MILTSPAIYLGQFDCSGFLNKVSLSFKFAPEPNARFGDLARVKRAGLRMDSGAFSGYADPDVSSGMESIGMSKLGLANVPFAVSPVGGAVGDVAYFFKAMKADLETFGEHGKQMPYVGNVVSGSDGRPAARGSVLLAKAARTVSANSAVTQVGAVSATQRLYAALHVFAKSGTTPTLDVAVKSAALVGFGTPTTRVSFTQATAETSEIVSVAGAITDAFWRVDATIAGTSPSFTFAVLVGIGPA